MQTSERPFFGGPQPPETPRRKGLTEEELHLLWLDLTEVAQKGCFPLRQLAQKYLGILAANDGGAARNQLGELLRRCWFSEKSKIESQWPQ